MSGPGPITLHEARRCAGWPLPLRVERLSSGRFIVVDREGTPRSAVTNHEDVAEALADRFERAAEARIIRCLNPRCRAEMASEGAHNRLCPTCRSGDVDTRNGFAERARLMGYADLTPPRITLPPMPWEAA